MRRVLGFVLVGLGVALLTLGVAVKYWAYPRIAQVGAVYPTQKDVDAKTQPPAGTVVSSGSAEVFIAVGDNPVGPQVVDVVSTRTVQGDPKSAKGGHVYWETRVDTSVPDKSADPINRTVEGLCFDNVTGEQQSDCFKKPYYQTGADATSRTNPDRKGVYLKFPFRTRPTAYQFWDSASGAAYQARYVATEKIQGLTVYKFEQKIPDVSLGQQQVPGVLFGGAPDSTAATADIRYANVRTLWVEPETGAIIKGQEQQDRRLVANGVTVPMLVGTLAYSEQTVKTNVEVQSANASSLHMLRVTLPAWGSVIGFLMAIGGVALVFLSGTGRRRAGRPDDAGPDSVDLRGVPAAADDVR
ncbi:DUF3068 domain-containing protein [Kineosporia sp. A_224]|uniref:DUF3068 domain-containing protein n=1 Tax=Kineosporia sp. A_224 TaxID=1962180 RepID=UPI000B4A650B|nr:DUF3068 domain-containing protein [Kineosporia sp. A_224]